MNVFPSLAGRCICIDMGTIYSIKNKLNGKEYIGQTRHPVKYRWRDHVYTRDRISSVGYALRKHGVENFEFNVIETCDDDMMNDREIFWIAERRTMAPQGYNQTSGGSSYSSSDETKKKISAGQRQAYETGARKAPVTLYKERWEDAQARLEKVEAELSSLRAEVDALKVWKSSIQSVAARHRELSRQGLTERGTSW